MASTEKNMKGTDVWVIDDDLWEELIELTHGAAAPCFQCGVCTAVCPWGNVRDETISVRQFIRKAQLGIVDDMDSIWLCTACGQCEAQCPRGVPIAEVIRGLRYILWKRRNVLEGLPSLLWSMHWNNNPWLQPPSQRTQWAADLDLPSYSVDEHEFLFYVGCTPSYDRRAQKVARALVKIFAHANLSFGVLGEHEPCCGEAVLSVGHIPYFEEIVENATGIFAENRVESVVTISPHCYDAFKNHYPRLNERFQPLHYTQLLARMVRENTLSFAGEFPNRVTFHDPCLLGRKDGDYESPRVVLEAIPGVSLVEMAHSGPDALCCGGGGGRMWMETPASERFGDVRVREAVDTGASVIATACPYCIACLEDSIKSLGVEGVVVMDVAEIAAEALVVEG
jgi:Fe-S oxidoreductase